MQLMLGDSQQDDEIEIRGTPLLLYVNVDVMWEDEALFGIYSAHVSAASFSVPYLNNNVEYSCVLVMTGLIQPRQTLVERRGACSADRIIRQTITMLNYGDIQRQVLCLPAHLLFYILYLLYFNAIVFSVLL